MEPKYTIWFHHVHHFTIILYNIIQVFYYIPVFYYILFHHYTIDIIS